MNTESINISIIFYSMYGHVYQMAEAVAEGSNSLADTDATIYQVPELVPEDVLKDSGAWEAKQSFDHIAEATPEVLENSDAVIFGTPTYLGNFSWQMKAFLDKGLKVKLAGKLGAVFATEKYLGGGADFALMTMIGHLLVKGMLVYSAGVSHGDPYTHFGAVCIQDGDEKQQERARLFGERIAKKVVDIYYK